MSDPKTSLGLPRSTSSRVSAGGAMQLDLLAGPTTDPSGLAPALANPSATPASEQGPKMNGTSGPRCTAWSQPSGLLSSLASKWQAEQVSPGSTVYALIWKLRATPQGRSICALRASALRTSGSVCGGWPTPSTMDSGNTGTAWEARREAMKAKHQNGNGFGLILPMAAQLAGWPTPGAKDGDKSVRTPEGAEAEAQRRGWTNDLCTAAHCAGWPTPQARDHKGADLDGVHDRGGKGPPLNEVVRLAGWATPTTSDHRGAATPEAVKDWASRGHNLPEQTQLASGPTPITSPAVTAKLGQLNPAHSRWLMGYPTEWDDCAPMATPSSRKSPRKF